MQGCYCVYAYIEFVNASSYYEYKLLLQLFINFICSSQDLSNNVYKESDKIAHIASVRPSTLYLETANLIQHIP